MNFLPRKECAAEAEEAVVSFRKHQPTSRDFFTTHQGLPEILVAATSSNTLIPWENKVRWYPSWSSAN
jgi:hypothetical protein